MLALRLRPALPSLNRFLSPTVITRSSIQPIPTISLSFRTIARPFSKAPNKNDLTSPTDSNSDPSAESTYPPIHRNPSQSSQPRGEARTLTDEVQPFNEAQSFNEEAKSPINPLQSEEEQRIKVKKSMFIAFNCNVCQTRNQKQMSRHAYHHGVVIIQCEGCRNNHLIADRLGWFRREGVDVELLMREKGQSVRKHVADEGERRGLMEWFPEDLIDWEKSMMAKSSTELKKEDK
jgi:hypothetical protein